MDLKMTSLLTIFFVLCIVNNSSAPSATWPSNDDDFKIRSNAVNRREHVIGSVVLDRSMDNSGTTTASVEKIYWDGCTKNHISSDCKKLNSYCHICKEASPQADVTAGETVCYSRNPIQLKKMFQTLYNALQDVELLHIVVLNAWKGYLPSTPERINITPLLKFKYLKSLKLTPCYEDLRQSYFIYFEQDTFKNLVHLETLHINIASTDQSFANIVSHLTKLIKLDLSFTREISMVNMTDTLRAVHNTSLRSLILQTFQRAGSDGFNLTLDIPNFFSNKKFSLLEELVISENSLARFTPGITSVAPNLKFFDISGNIILDGHNIAFLAETLMHHNIEVFNMAYQGYVGGRKLIRHKQETWNDDNQIQYNGLLTSLDKPSHSVAIKSNGVIIGCVNSKTDIAGQPNASRLFSNDTYQNKKLIHDILQCLFPINFKEGPPVDTFPPIAQIFNAHCAISISFPMAPNLRSLYMNQLHLEAAAVKSEEIGQNFCFMENNLTHFVFTDNAYWIKAAKIEDFLSSPRSITGLDKLASIDLSRNGLSLHMTLVTNSLHLPNIQNFSIAYNNITLGGQFKVCQQWPLLQRLNIRGNMLGEKPDFPEELLSGCSQLQELDLSYNHLNVSQKVSALKLHNLYNFKMLNLSENHFTILKEEMRNAIDHVAEQSSGLLVDLNDNPLVCSCESLPFTKWITDHVANANAKVKFHNYKYYKCLDHHSVVRYFYTLTPPGVTKFYSKCYPNRLISDIKIVGETLACVLLVFLLCILYQKRWRIRYQIFLLKPMLQRLIYSTKHKTPENWKYDAFVSYCSDDRFWVHGEFRKTLENTYGFHLCLRYRDFKAGETISKAILDSIQQSREIIIIISDAGLTREWNLFELEHSNLQSTRRKKRLIIIKMGELKKIGENPLAANLLYLHHYIEWSDDKDRVPVFWDKLVRNLYGKGSSKRQWHCHSIRRCCKLEQGYQEIEGSVDCGITGDYDAL